MEIRKIKEKDQFLLGDLYNYSYTEWTEKGISEEHKAWLIPEETFALFEDGRLVSTLRVHDFLQCIRGVIKKMGGIAGVATFPEARQKGCIRALMEAAFNEMQEKGQSVSMLDPFKESFYAQFGYVKTNASYIIKAPFDKLVSTKENKSDPDWEIERVRATKVREQLFTFIKESVLPQFHGFVVYNTITEGMWNLLAKDSIVAFVKYKGAIQAIARYRIIGEIQNDKRITEMRVIDFFWKTRKARAKLFNYLSKHKEQLHNISISAPFDTSVEHWFTDIDLLVRRRNNWMVRVIDAPKAVNGLPALGEDMIILELSDPLCSWNNGVFLLQSNHNKLKMTKSTGKPTVKASIKAFSSLVYGILPLEELEFQGELKISESWARHALKRWFPPLPLYNVVIF